MTLYSLQVDMLALLNLKKMEKSSNKKCNDLLQNLEISLLKMQSLEKEIRANLRILGMISDKIVTLGDIASIHDSKRVPLNSRERSVRKGEIPYYGAQGIVDYIGDFVFDGDYVLIAEDEENLRSRKQPIAFRRERNFG